ncbi:hypothetical protein KAT63_05230, partial [Candidatus Parcubacteria bacterium]|nr:hypothetical protein [Candidatus Parcubacteria bacterium]
MSGSNNGSSDEDFFDRVPLTLTKREGPKGKRNRSNAAKDSEKYANFRPYGVPIKFFESIVVAIGLFSIAYLLYASKMFFVEGTTLKSIFGIVIFLMMACITLAGKSIAVIVIRDIKDFKERFSYEETGEMITTSDQISFLMNLVISALKSWKISWLVYTAAVMVLYLIAFYFGLFMAVIILLILLAVIVLKGPETLDNLEGYFRSKTRNIPADPPSIGVMTLFGNPLGFDLILDAGIAIIYPGIIDFLTVEVHQEPQDFKDMKGFITKDNIPVELKKVQVLYIPDLLRIAQFISAKKQPGVYDAMDSMISNRLKDIIRGLSFADLLSRKGELELEVKLELTGKKAEDDEIRKMGQNGVSDDHLLGVNLFRFNIGTIETTEEYTKEMLK